MNPPRKARRQRFIYEAKQRHSESGCIFSLASLAELREGLDGVSPKPPFFRARGPAKRGAEARRHCC